MTEEKFYTPLEVAEMLKLHRNTVIKLILARKLPALVVGKQYRITESGIAEFRQQNTITMANPKVS